MVAKASKFLKSIFAALNLFVIASYLVVCFVPFINTSQYWYFAFFGLFFPLIFFVLLGLLILWAVVRSKWFWPCLVTLLLGTQQILAVFGFNLPKDFEKSKAPNTLRVMQWNVTSWDENEWDKDKREKGKAEDKTNRPLMLDLVRKQNADILCFEEFFEPIQNKYFEENIIAIEKMGYPYHYFVSSVTYKHLFKSGVAIFSKYPIIDSAKINFGEATYAEHLIYADIKVNEKIFRVFTIHLQSVRFKPEDYESISDIKHTKQEGLKDSKTIVSKLKKGYTYRYSQAETVREQIDASPYPVILCGDFNDVPNSNTYFTVRGNLQDAFLKKGFFVGRTFRFISPTLRIDYILANKLFSIKQMQLIHVPWSDHYPVEADLQY